MQNSVDPTSTKMDVSNQIIHDQILKDANLPESPNARAAIIKWFSSRHMRRYIAGQMNWQGAPTGDPSEYQINGELRLSLRHIIDYLHRALTDETLPTQYQIMDVQLTSSPVEVILNRCRLFDKWSHRKAIRQQVEGNLVEGVDFREIFSITLKDDMRLVELLTPRALDVEGKMMVHCIGDGTYDDRIGGKSDYHQFSLLDTDGNPHCTFEVHHGKLLQCHGRSHAPPGQKYSTQVSQIITGMAWEFNDNDVNRTGLIKDRHGKTCFIFDLPEVFDGDLNLESVTILESLCKVRVITGNLNLKDSAVRHLERLEEVHGDAHFCVGIFCSRPIRVGGKTVWNQPRQTKGKFMPGP